MVIMPRRTTAPFLIVAAALFVLLVASNMPTPLYAVYRERFGFSSAVLTLIFATYAVVLVPSLLVFGQMSDRLGRRRVIAAGLGVAMVGLALFAAARGTAWLFAARAVQGLSVGAITGAATAGLVELEPHGDRQRAALLSVLAQAGGCAAGPLTAGALAQWAPEPRVLCYLVALVVIAAAAVAAMSIPEPAASATGRWEIQRPSVPSAIRAGFARVSLTGAAVWAVAALFLSVVPSYAAKLLDTDDLALLGAIAATMLATSCATQWLASGRASVGAQPAGLAVLAGGLVALVVAFPLHSLAIVLAAALLAGAGHGLAFLGAQTELNHLAPSDRRGEVTAAFMSCIYGGVAVSVIGVGLVSTSASLFTAVAAFAAAIGATAVLTAGWHLAR